VKIVRNSTATKGLNNKNIVKNPPLFVLICCGTVDDLDEEENCDDPAKGVEGDFAVICPSDVLDVPEKDKENCMTINDDITVNGVWSIWATQTASARVAFTENEDHTFNTVVTMFFPGVNGKKHCQLVTKRSETLSIIADDKAGNTWFVPDAERQTNFDTSTTKGSESAGYTVTYTITNGAAPCLYLGAY